MSFEFTKQLKWLYAHSRGCRAQAAVNAFVGLTMVALSLWYVDTFRSLTDMATGARDGDIIPTAMLLGGIFIAELVLRCCQTWVSATLGVRTQNNMQRHFFAHLLRGEWKGVETYHSGDVLNRLFGDVTDIVNLMTDVLPMFVTISVQFVASFVYLYRIDSTLAIMLVVTSPVFLILSRLYFRRMRRIVRHVKDSNSTLQAIIQECVQHRMVVKVLQQENAMIDRLERRQQLLQRQTKSRARISIYTKVLINVGFTGAYLVGFVMGLLQLHDGLITVGVLMAFTQLIHRIQRPMLDMARLLPIFINSMTSADRLMELESMPLDPVPAPVDMPQQVGIQFSNVSYSYVSKGRRVLSGFSHTFLPGSFTAILGETGAGKTTLIRMMLSLISPQQGTVSLVMNGDNSALNDNLLPITTSTRGIISYIPQGNTLFSGTIRENLMMGNPDATTEEMYNALHIAMADFVHELPDGLYTRCGEQGGGLSEGQAQRIAIARAILRPCRLLLLDEATSALDVQTERELLENIKRHFADTTIIFVTHRLAVVDFTTDSITMQRQKQ